MHLPALISDFALILGVAGVVTLLFRKIRQPIVLGYIVAGFIVGPYTSIPLNVSDFPNINISAELGVIFLMFSLGLEFTFHKLKRVGGVATGTALLEVFLMVSLGFGAGRVLGWSTMDSIFLGGILSVSSTTIIIKAFDELGLKSRRFAEIVFGVLIVEDLVAILLLVALSTLASTQELFSAGLLFATGKLVLVVGSWFLVGYFVIPRFFKYAAKYLSNENLIVLSVGLCFSLVTLAAHFNYSTALGAFIMGSILAETNESHRIETLVEPLRDFFATIFFVSVGMLVNPATLKEHFSSICLITFITIIGKVLSTTIGALFMGQPLKRCVQIGFSLAQIGEFSFIIATLGATLKVTSDFLYPIAVAVSVITTFLTPYLIRVSEASAMWLEKSLPSGLLRRLSHYSHGIQSRVDAKAQVGFSQKLGIFLSTLFSLNAHKEENPHLKRLAPWDLHLNRMAVHPNSNLSGKTINALKIRSNYGLNIVGIQRGSHVIVSPTRDEMLLPHDELLVLGSEDQIDSFQQVTEGVLDDKGSAKTLADYSLQRIVISEDSDFLNKTIQGSGIREMFQSLVVGLEREHLRTINPNPTTILQAHDILWIIKKLA